jgi:hypothetical protein
LNIIKIGDRFGHLVVIKDSGMRQNKHTIFECVCDCGNTHYVRSIGLTQGHAKSCGCQKYKNRKGIKRKKLIRNSTYNQIGIIINNIKLTDLTKDSKGTTCAILKCHCGNVIIKPLNEYKKGNIKSCGCISDSISKSALQKRKEKELNKLKPKSPRKTKLYTPPKDYTDTQCGHLSVLYWCGIGIGKEGNKHPLWYCQCDCGKYVVKGSNAFKNINISCGCTMYQWRKNNAQRTSNIKRNKIISFIKEEWTPRDDIDHKNRRMRKTVKVLILTKYPNGCVICNHKGSNDNKLCGHHYKPHALYPKYRYMIINQVILCENCHNGLHKQLGYDCTSIPQQINYIKNMKEIVQTSQINKQGA